MKRAFLRLAAVAAIGFLPLGASAVTAACSPVGSLVGGNDCSGVLGSAFADCQCKGPPYVIAKWEVLGDGSSTNPFRFEAASDVDVNTTRFPSVSASSFSFTIDPTTGALGTRTYTGDVGITTFVLKAGSANSNPPGGFRVFELTNPFTATDYNGVPWSTLTAGLLGDGEGGSSALPDLLL